jgi:hypothetical protein
VRVCLLCGLSIESMRSDARYCSSPCRTEASRLKAILSGSGNHDPRAGGSSPSSAIDASALLMVARGEAPSRVGSRNIWAM